MISSSLAVSVILVLCRNVPSFEGGPPAAWVFCYRRHLLSATLQLCGPKDIDRTEKNGRKGCKMAQQTIPRKKAQVPHNRRIISPPHKLKINHTPFEPSLPPSFTIRNLQFRLQPLLLTILKPPANGMDKGLDEEQIEIIMINIPYFIIADNNWRMFDEKM